MQGSCGQGQGLGIVSMRWKEVEGDKTCVMVSTLVEIGADIGGANQFPSGWAPTPRACSAARAWHMESVG